MVRHISNAECFSNYCTIFSFVSLCFYKLTKYCKLFKLCLLFSFLHSIKASLSKVSAFRLLNEMTVSYKLEFSI